MNHNQDEQPTLGSSENPTALPAITDPDAVTRALGAQVHLIRTQFVRDRLASGQCTAKHITAMLEWERFAPEGIRMNFGSAMYWSGRLSPFDRDCISLELQQGFHVPPEHYDAAKHLDDECHAVWQRYEDVDAARASVETLTQLRDRIQEEVDRVRTGPDHSAAGVIGALLQRPKATPTAPPRPPLGPEAREALLDAVQVERNAALAVRSRLRIRCEELRDHQRSWEDRRATVDPTGVLLGYRVDRAVYDLDKFLANAYQLMGEVWEAADRARNAAEALALD